jgi:glycosyltransferase involved in cell wall biosynthesis
MAAGLPCFATNVSGLNDVIDQPYLFEVGDATDLAAKIVAIKASEELYQEAARYAVKQSIKFSIATSALEYTRVYNLCMASVSR